MQLIKKRPLMFNKSIYPSTLSEKPESAQDQLGALTCQQN